MKHNYFARTKAGITSLGNGIRRELKEYTTSILSLKGWQYTELFGLLLTVLSLHQSFAVLPSIEGELDDIKKRLVQQKEIVASYNGANKFFDQKELSFYSDVYGMLVAYEVLKNHPNHKEHMKNEGKFTAYLDTILEFIRTPRLLGIPAEYRTKRADVEDLEMALRSKELKLEFEVETRRLTSNFMFYLGAMMLFLGKLFQYRHEAAEVTLSS